MFTNFMVFVLPPIAVVIVLIGALWSNISSRRGWLHFGWQVIYMASLAISVFIYFYRTRNETSPFGLMLEFLLFLPAFCFSIFAIAMVLRHAVFLRSED